MASMECKSFVKTRILVLSDTHSYDEAAIELPAHQADIAIHCGDLTDGSSLAEFRAAVRLLHAIDARLKLVIPGNHDFTMDPVAFAGKIADSSTPLDRDLVAQTYGEIGQSEELMRSAADAGIQLLAEGTHRFELENGASLTIFASAFTPSLGTWGFQYHPDKGHDFWIHEGTDIVMTHGPPRGILDYTDGRERAGCPDLFTAVARSRPRLHCFGHIHEGWGARFVTWKDESGDEPTHFTSIDNDKSVLIAKLSSFTDSEFDSPEDTVAKVAKRTKLAENRCFMTRHCADDKLPIHHGKSTLFVNAAVCDRTGSPSQKVWMIDLDLPRLQHTAEN